MRILVSCLFLATLTLLLTLPTHASDRPFRQTHNIEINVECIAYATEVIRSLNGYNLESTITLNEHQRAFNPWRQADFTRRVDAWAFRQVQEVLRGLGEVRTESESARFLGGEIMDIDAQIAATSQEIDRLSLMMARSDSLDILITIDHRISELSWHLNSLLGRRNVLYSQAASPVITIRLFEATDMPSPTRPTFVRRVTDSFLGSLRATIRGAGHVLVFFARISIPLVAWGALLALALYVYVKIPKRKQPHEPKPLPIPDTAHEANANKEDHS